MGENMDTLTRGGPGHQQMQQQSHDWYALCDSKEPMLSIQDFYETDDLQVWTYFEPILHNDTHIAESEQHITQTTKLLGGGPVAEIVVRAFIDNVQFNLASSIRGHYIVFHHRVPALTWWSSGETVAAAFATTELILSSPKVSLMVSRYCYMMVVQMCTIIRRGHLAVKFAREVVEKAAASNPFLSVVTLIQRLLGEKHPVCALFLKYIKNLIHEVLNDNFLSVLTCASVNLEKMVLLLVEQNGSCLRALSNQIKAEKQFYRNVPKRGLEGEDEEEEKHNYYEWG